MPKNTYFDLPDEKKKRIKQAVYDEYISKPYDEVTTRTLTKRAGIPMGSLYQYFEDKDEAYLYHYMELEYRGKLYYFEKMPNDSDEFDINLLNTKFADMGIFSEEELSFYDTIDSAPDDVVKKLIFDYYDKLNIQYKDLFKKTIKLCASDKNIEDSKYFNFLLYIYFTVSFNAKLYFKKDNIKTMDEKIEYTNYLYKDIIIKALQ